MGIFKKLGVDAAVVLLAITIAFANTVMVLTILDVTTPKQFRGCVTCERGSDNWITASQLVPPLVLSLLVCLLSQFFPLGRLLLASLFALMSLGLSQFVMNLWLFLPRFSDPINARISASAVFIGAPIAAIVIGCYAFASIYRKSRVE